MIGAGLGPGVGAVGPPSAPPRKLERDAPDSTSGHRCFTYLMVCLLWLTRKFLREVLWGSRGGLPPVPMGWRSGAGAYGWAAGAGAGLTEFGCVGLGLKVTGLCWGWTGWARLGRTRARFFEVGFYDY